MENRIIVYGDIHGCLDELQALRKKLDIHEGDQEYSVGDFLNKGPYSRKTLNYLQKNNIRSTMGNNEEKIINIYREYQQKGESFLKTLKKPTQKTIQELQTKDVDFLESLPYFIKIDQLTILHGGITNAIHLDKELSKKEKRLITQLRFFNKEKEPIPYADFEHRDTFWSEVYDGHEGFIVFGHHPFEVPKETKYAVGIDTGCVYGRALTAVTFPYHDGKVDTKNYTFVSVKPVKKYFC